MSIAPPPSGYSELIRLVVTRAGVVRCHADVVAQQQLFPRLEGAGFTTLMRGYQERFKRSASVVAGKGRAALAGILTSLDSFVDVWTELLEEITSNPDEVAAAASDFARYIQKEAEQCGERIHAFAELLEGEWAAFNDDYELFHDGLAADATEDEAKFAAALSRVQSINSAICADIDRIVEGYDKAAEGGAELVTGVVGVIDLAPVIAANSIKNAAKTAIEQDAPSKSTFLVSAAETVGSGAAELNEARRALRADNEKLIEGYQQLARLEVSVTIARAIGIQAGNFGDSLESLKKEARRLDEAWSGMAPCEPDAIERSLGSVARSWTALSPALKRSKRQFAHAEELE